MKKFFILFAVVLGFASSSFAQAMDGNIEFNKTAAPGASVEIAVKSDVAESAIKDKMNTLGYKSSSFKGFYVFRNFIDTSVNSQPVDLFLKVDRKSRGEKDKSIVQMVTAIRDSVVVSPGAKMFLNKLIPHTEAYNLNLDISAQEEVVTKNQKKFDNLVDDSVSLVKKIKNLTEDLANNRNKRQEQQKEVEKQKAVLETLKSRRKN
jgi:hypothetical protein